MEKYVINVIFLKMIFENIEIYVQNVRKNIKKKNIKKIRKRLKNYKEVL